MITQENVLFIDLHTGSYKSVLLFKLSGSNLVGRSMVLVRVPNIVSVSLGLRGSLYDYVWASHSLCQLENGLTLQPKHSVF